MKFKIWLENVEQQLTIAQEQKLTNRLVKIAMYLQKYRPNRTIDELNPASNRIQNWIHEFDSGKELLKQSGLWPYVAIETGWPEDVEAGDFMA